VQRAGQSSAGPLSPSCSQRSDLRADKIAAVGNRG
jgi:hypothetical protein